METTIQKIKTLPESLQEVYLTCNTIIQGLIRDGKETPENAETAVLALLKESATDLQSGRHKEVVVNLRVIYQEYFNTDMDQEIKSLIRHLK